MERPTTYIQTNSNEILDGRRLVAARVSWIIFAATLTPRQILSQVAMLQQLPNSDLAQVNSPPAATPAE